MSLKVKDLVKCHAGAPSPVLKGVSFELETGSLAAILGSSGAGKTTLLRCLVGLEPFDSGEIDVDGCVVHGATGPAASRALLAERAKLRSTVGLVFLSFELFPHLRVLDNLTLAPMKVRGLDRKAGPR